ncbi:DNA-directed RNA polymerase, partial [Operophtera brumata]
MPKEQYRETYFGRKISHVTFNVDSASAIQQAAHIQVITKNLYAQDGQRVPAAYGVLDRRMGTNQKDANCDTCGLGLAECVGHYGYIELALPVFHVGYFRSIICILQTICKECAKVMLPEALKKSYRRKFLNPELSYLHKKTLRAAIIKKTKPATKCPHCGTINGMVKKSPAGILKIIHDKYRAKKSTDPIVKRVLKDFHEAKESNKELATMINSEDIPLLGMNAKKTRPDDLIITRLPVPPLCIRPSVVSEIKAGTNEDDLTMKQSEILLINDVIARHVASGGKSELIQEDWDYLQLHVALYINSEMSGIPLSMQGRFRGNLSGKRVDFSSRTVISPDPNLQIQERVFPANLAWLRALVCNGTDVHPGANYVQQRGLKLKKYLKYGNREKIAQELKVRVDGPGSVADRGLQQHCGDIVERHLVDGDVVLFNRQPSLHKLSIMCHRAKVQPQRTFRFNECDFITGGYLMTQRDTFFTREEAAQLAACLLAATDATLHVIIRNSELICGSMDKSTLGSGNKTSIFYILLRDCGEEYAVRGMWRYVPRGSHCRAQEHAGLRQQDQHLLHPAARLRRGVRRTYHAAHTVERKSTLGSGNKTSIFYILLRDCGEEYAVRGMWRYRKSTLGSGNKTSIFYILLRDCGEEYAVRGMWRYSKCDGYILEMQKGTLQCQPGCTMEESLEAVMLSELSSIRELAAQACFRELHPTNAPLVMAQSGSK